ncbi:MAG: hypothetical protein BWY71_02405 [Planctomycetes bacterium ADurb.Bin412]|nr:MAG: hypothetical protein BWY71_02405 [Planctomycetes bacterium ADurb.Bin412]
MKKIRLIGIALFAGILILYGGIIRQSGASVKEPILPFRSEGNERFRAIQDLLNQGQYEKAWQQLAPMETAAAAAGCLDEYRYLSGMALLGRGQTADAGLAFMKVVVFHKESVRYGMALYRLAEVHERLERYDVAYALYKEVNELPSSVANSQPRGRAAERLEKLKLARENRLLNF